MINNIKFGVFIHKLRKEKNITLTVLSDGLCDFSQLAQIEKGNIEPRKLLRDRLFGRLGVATENYESFLFYKEYKEQRERQEIISSILYGKIEEAKQLLMQYQVEYLREGELEHQFYLTMLAQIRKLEGADKEELKQLFQKAVCLTICEPIKKQLKYRVLSIEELNLLLEYAFYQEEEVSLEWYKEFISYIEQFSLDDLALSKIYPKAIYYFYQIWEKKNNIENKELGIMLNFCNRAIEILRKAKRMYYLLELLEVKKKLLQKLIELNTEKQKKEIEQLQQSYKVCVHWMETLEQVYEDYGIPKKMQDFCYIYMDMEAHCIGDVIKIRRKMFGMTMKELSEGICSERTVSRLENNKMETQREIVFLLFQRLHMSMEFYKNDLLTGNPKAKRLFRELKQANNQLEYEKVEQLLEQVKEMVSLDIPENRQAIGRSEIIKEYNKKRLNKELLDKQFYIKKLKEVLEYTIPYEIAVASGEKYLTQNELSCLQNIMSRMDWTYPEKEQCVQALYDLLEHQREIEDCLNMYEFVMGTVASHLGNKGEYDISDEIGMKILQNTIWNRRLGVIDRGIYELLWNDVQRKKEQHPVKRDVDITKELEKCRCLCEMCCDKRGMMFFEKKLKEGM